VFVPFVQVLIENGRVLHQSWTEIYNDKLSLMIVITAFRGFCEIYCSKTIRRICHES